MLKVELSPFVVKKSFEKKSSSDVSRKVSAVGDKVLKEVTPKVKSNKNIQLRRKNQNRKKVSSSSSISSQDLESGAVWDKLLEKYPQKKKKDSVQMRVVKRKPRVLKPIQVERDLEGAIDEAMEIRDQKTLYCMMMPLNSLVGAMLINPRLLNNKSVAARIQNSLRSQGLIALASKHSHIRSNKLFLSLMAGAMVKDSSLLKK